MSSKAYIIYPINCPFDMFKQCDEEYLCFLKLFDVHSLDVDLCWTNGANQAILLLPCLNWTGRKILTTVFCWKVSLIIWKIHIKQKYFKGSELVNFSCQDSNKNIVLSKIKFSRSFENMIFPSIFQYFKLFYFSAKFW